MRTLLKYIASILVATGLIIVVVVLLVFGIFLAASDRPGS